MKDKDLKAAHEIEDLLGTPVIPEKELFEKAEKGDASILYDRNVNKRAEGYGTWTPLHYLADKKVLAILEHPEVATALDADSNTPLHFLARQEVIEVLNHPMCGYIFNRVGESPLHTLACSRIWFGEELTKIVTHAAAGARFNNLGESVLHLFASEGVEEVLEHPDVATAKNSDGWTPLHYLAEAGVNVLSHPAAALVKNSHGKTPKDLYDGMTKIQRYEAKQLAKARKEDVK